MKTTPLWRSLAPRLLLILAAGALITAWLVARQEQLNAETAQSRLDQEAQRISRDVIARFQLYEYGTRGFRGMLLSHAAEGMNRSHVQAYSRSRAASEFPGARGFGFIERVPSERVDRFLVEARADGAPDFAIRQLTPHDDERFVIRYIEPLENNRPAMGLDIASEANRRNAALTAMRENTPVITGPITLVQATGAKLRSFLLLLPVYRPGVPIDTPAQREAACLGWTYTPLVTDEVVRGLPLGNGLMHLSMQDVTAAEPDTFFEQAVPEPRATAVPGLSASVRQTVFGRQWQMNFTAYPAFVEQLRLTQPSTIGMVGALVTVLLASMQLLWSTVTQRRREAREANALLAAIVENASDAIVSESLDGRVLSWNKAAESLFGYPSEMVLGKPLASLLLPPSRQAEDQALLEKAADRERIAPFETTRLHRNGQPIDISMTVSSICDERNQLVGAAKLMRDISERKRYELNLLVLNAQLEERVRDRTQALNQTSRFLMTVLNSVPLMIAYVQDDLRHKVVNRAYAAALGCQPTDLEGQALPGTLGEELLQTLNTRFRDTLAGASQSFEVTLPSRGDRAGVELLVQCIPDAAAERVLGFYLIAQDVTELNAHRRELEHSLEEQRNERLRLQSIIQGTGAGTWEWHVPTGEVRINDEWAHLLGYARAELEPMTGDAWSARVHPDDLKAARALVRRHIAGELPHFEQETRMRHRDGHWVWVLTKGQLINRDPGGEPEWMFGTLLDIHARKTAEASLRESEMFLERVGKVAGVGGWRLRLADRQVTWTAQTRRISGVEDDYQPSLDTALSFYPPEVHAELAMAIQTAIDHGTPFDLELPYLTARGESRWVRSVGEAEYAHTAGDGRPVALVGALMDFTERHKAAEELRRAQTAAEQANRSKSVFLANMSHEIRTPLNAVLGVFYLLMDTKLDAGQRQLLGKAQLAGRTLLGIVNDVLDLAKIEAGELMLSEEPYDLTDLLREIESVYAPQATLKGVHFELTVDRHLPRWLTGDVQRVRQILTNLIGNAVKFTPSGSIRLSAQRMAGPSAEKLRLSVQDTGIGIPLEAQAQLFAPFVQVDSTNTRQFGGTGLGLSIVRQLSEAMSGQAGLRSAPGDGSEFWVELPLVEPSSRASTGTTAAQDPLEVVVVDDNHTDRAAMASMVRSLGWRAVELSSGEELIHHVAERIESGQNTPDALLVDWHMPGLNGVAALDALSRRVGPDRLPAALVASAHDRERIHDLNHTTVTNRLLTKPLEVYALFNAISESITQREGGTERLLRHTRLTDLQAQWLQGVTVLLVDDGDVNREIAQRLLEKYGAAVHTAKDGKQALEVLRERGRDIDAVLMDIQMPVMDGLEATRRLRQDMGLTRLPVIALTAGALVQERDRAFAAGMNDFIAKPVEPDTLIRAVRRQVERARGAPLPMARAVDPRKLPSDWPLIDGVDTLSAATRLDHDVHLFLRMLGWIGSDFADISALENEDQLVPMLDSDASREALCERLHKLRGSAGTIGAEVVQAQAKAAEVALRARSRDEASLVLSVGEALRRLIRNSQPAIDAGLHKHDPATEATPANEADDAERPTMTALMDLLRMQDLQAIDVARQLQGDLSTVFDPETAILIARSIDNLDFARALGLMEGVIRS